MGKLIERSADRWSLRQYNPPSVVVVEVDSIRRTHRIVDWPELVWDHTGGQIRQYRLVQHVLLGNRPDLFRL